MSTPTDPDYDDSLPPLLNFDGDNVAMASGSHRPGLRPRRLSSGVGMTSQSYSQLRRARTRKFSQSSLEDLLPPKFEPTEAQLNDKDDGFEQPSSSSKKLLSFFAIPVVAGILFEDGASIAVDLMLVGLACLSLYWSVEIPWQWYFYARTLALESSPEMQSHYQRNIDSSDEEDLEQDPTADPIKAEGQNGSLGADVDASHQATTDKPEWQQLHSYELYALALCFAAPPVMAYILHKIREYLARPNGSPVENASFILFVMVAELPPLNQACKLLFAHTLYLQRIVASYDVLEDDKVKQLKTAMERRDDQRDRSIEELSRTIAELQDRLANPSPPSESRTPTSDRSESKQSNSTQMQVDALNRAVRRYEKRAITQALVYEGRLKDLDLRINDALTLAAATSRAQGQKTGAITWILDTISHIILLPFTMLHMLFSVPFSALNDLYKFLLGPRRKNKKPNHNSKVSDPGYRTRQRLEER